MSVGKFSDRNRLSAGPFAGVRCEQQLPDSTLIGARFVLPLKRRGWFQLCLRLEFYDSPANQKGKEMPTSTSSSATALSRLRQASPTVLPSMLMCDFTNLEQEVRRLEDAGVAGLHLDVMDGHFVPNLTYGLTIVDAFRKVTDLPLDAHLMIANPEEYAEQFVDAGADVVTIHTEATDSAAEILRAIRARGAAAGLALNPNTPLESISDAQAEADLILVMSVQPGFGGQSFQKVALEKLTALRDNKELTAILEVDGGVNDKTIASCAAAGADLAVVGSAIFAHEDYAARFTALMQLLRGKKS